MDAGYSRRGEATYACGCYDTEVEAARARRAWFLQNGVPYLNGSEADNAQAYAGGGSKRRYLQQGSLVSAESVGASTFHVNNRSMAVARSCKQLEERELGQEEVTLERSKRSNSGFVGGGERRRGEEASSARG